MIPGIDQISEIEKYKDLKSVLITTNSTYDSTGNLCFKIIKEIFKRNLKEIWSLQHGFFNEKQDNMKYSNSFYWKDFELFVRSFYSDDISSGINVNQDIELIIIDVFDVGTRVYTFLNHVIMILMGIKNVNKNIKILVLDRPNILGKKRIEGNIIKEDYFSIVGIIPIPMRHSLTQAEFISFGIDFYELNYELIIVKVIDINYDIDLSVNFSNPSPNMTSINTAIVYPGAVMLEGTNLSEGRGTTKPFEFIGAPYLDNFNLIRKLNKLKLKNVDFLPVFFKPEFSKHKGRVCNGLMIKPRKIDEFESFEVYYEIIRLIYHDYDEFSWSKPPYEFEYDRLPIDMITGSDFIRKSIENNLKFMDIKKEIVDRNNDFLNKACKYFLY